MRWQRGLADPMRKALLSSTMQQPGQDGWAVGTNRMVKNGAEKQPVEGDAVAGGKGSAETKEGAAPFQSDRSAVVASEQPSAVPSSGGAASTASKQMHFAAGFQPNPHSACTLNALVLVLYPHLSSEPDSPEKERKLKGLEQMRIKASEGGDIDVGELYREYIKPLDLGWELRGVKQNQLIPILKLRKSYGPGAILLVTPADGVQEQGGESRGHTFAVELRKGGQGDIVWNPGRFNPDTRGFGVYAGSFPLVKNELDNVYNDLAWKKSGYVCWTGTKKRRKMYLLTKAQGKKKSQKI